MLFMKTVTLIILVLSAEACVGCASDSAPSGSMQVASPMQGDVVTSIDARIWNVYHDRSGNVWFGSNGDGVFRYDGDTIVRYTVGSGLHGTQVRDIKEDDAGNVLVSTTRGVSLFDGERFTTLEMVDVAFGEDGWVSAPGDVWLVVDPDRNGPCRFDGETLYRNNNRPNTIL